jgi:hypothetical protein
MSRLALIARIGEVPSQNPRAPYQSYDSSSVCGLCVPLVVLSLAERCELRCVLAVSPGWLCAGSDRW